MIKNIYIENDKLIVESNILGQDVQTKVNIDKNIIKQKENLQSYETKIEDKEFNFIIDNFLNILKSNPKGCFKNTNVSGKYIYYPEDIIAPMRLCYIYKGKTRAFELKINDVENKLEINLVSHYDGFNLKKTLESIKNIKELKNASDKDYIQILIDELLKIKNAE